MPCGRLMILAVCLVILPFAKSVQAETLFQDDFKGVERVMPDGETQLAPNASKWAFTFWPGAKWPDSYGNGTNWLENNGESQAYLSPWIEKVKGQPVPAALRYNPFKITADGLHIVAAKLSPEQQKAYMVGGHRRFGSGILISRRSFEYGTFTMVAKFPKARGSWPAFWLLAENHVWPPEVDVFEGMAWGSHAKQIHSGLLSDRTKMGSASEWYDLGFDPSQDFHTYKLNWTKDSMAVSVDGKILWTKPTPDSFKQPMYMLINLAVGGKWPYNELGVKPADSVAPERLSAGSDMIEAEYPAELVIKSITVTP